MGADRWSTLRHEPRPRVPHQDKAGNLFNRLFNFLEGNPCKIYIAPLDVYLRNEAPEKEQTVVQPDNCTVFQYVREGSGLSGERFASIREFRKGEPLESAVFPGFVWDCSTV